MEDKIQEAREFGMRLQKAFILKRARDWCEKPSDSAAFHPDQHITQGQVKTAKELLEFLEQ